MQNQVPPDKQPPIITVTRVEMPQALKDAISARIGHAKAERMQREHAVSVCLLCCVLLAVALTDTPAKFLQPRANFVHLFPGTHPTIPVQWFIPRNAENRAYVVTCRGACHWTAGPESMEGADAEAIKPRNPVYVEIDAEGTAVLTLSVFGADGKVRQYVTKDVKVCGGDDGCG